MKSFIRPLFYSSLVIAATLLAGCRVGGPAGNNLGGGGGGGAAGPFTIGVSVSGLATGSTGFSVNLATLPTPETIPITANGTTFFKTLTPKGTQVQVNMASFATNPPQSCTSPTFGTTLTITTNTIVTITCSATGGNTIGGQVVGLLGSGLVLQDNGADSTPIKTNGAFNFATGVPTGGAYAVTVSQQPSNPTQTCNISGGSGTANGTVSTVVVTCSSGTLILGGSVSGLSGTGLTLANTDGDTVSISGNGSFQFPILLVSGSSYDVTIAAQPTGPTQTCTISANIGTAVANVNTIQVTCPAVFHTIGGQIVGLYVPTGQTSDMVLQNNGGDNLPISGNGPFTFVTQVANGSAYDVSIFVQPSSQPGIYCTIWGWNGVATSNVVDITVDCGHNDWTWMYGPSASNQDATMSATARPVIPIAARDTDTPGGTKYGSGWTDLQGNLWLYSGSAHAVGFPNTIQFFNQMWEYVGPNDYTDGYPDTYWYLVPLASGGYPTPRWGAVTWTDTNTGYLWLFGGQDEFDNFLNDLWYYNTSSNTWTKVSGGFNLNGNYGPKGTAGAGYLPGGRWGATGRRDPASGTVWIFGGYGYDGSSTTPGLMNDLWTFDGTNWTWVSGSSTANQSGTYGTLNQSALGNVPGGRQASVSWLDNSGNFWMFGGFDGSPSGPNDFNDLWEFSAGQWKWVSGADVFNQTATYGAQGVAAATNVPGARYSPAAWSDASGNLWLFGGDGYDATANGTLADLWEFKGGQWIWVKGPNSVSQTGVYGIQPTNNGWPHVTSYPGSRWGATYFTAPFGFWMFGGEGFDATTGGGDQLLSDLWRYLPYP